MTKTKRLFLALPVNKDIKNQCNSFVEKQNLSNVKWVKEANWHITLIFIGEFQEDKIPLLTKHLATFFQNISPFKIGFNNFFYIPNQNSPRMIWGEFYHSKEFDIFVYETFIRLKTFYKKQDIPFDIKIRKRNKAHITLSRLREKNVKYPTLITQDSFRINQNIESCQLYESKLMHNGAEYFLLHEFRLGS
ncbi:MAG: RNA 2',3'-cyclic phosphodiesterase [Bacteroidota bacterium]|nr:RNA 2',3'-cyclic phosphodiesterase [Bacteroidota bacterium]